MCSRYLLEKDIDATSIQVIDVSFFNKLETLVALGTSFCIKMFTNNGVKAWGTSNKSNFMLWLACASEVFSVLPEKDIDATLIQIIDISIQIN